MSETRKIVGKASESVDGKNEVKDDGERVHGSKRHEEEQEEEEGRRERVKNGERGRESQARQTG